MEERLAELEKRVAELEKKSSSADYDTIIEAIRKGEGNFRENIEEWLRLKAQGDRDGRPEK